MPDGFCALEFCGTAPDPKSQKYVQPPPVLPVLVKLTGRLEHCGEVTLDTKLDEGARLIFIVVE